MTRHLGTVSCAVMMTLAGLIAFPAVTDAQVPAFTMTKVAEGVYTTVRRDEIQSPADGNSTVIINDHDVIVVDANLTASSAKAVLAELRKLTNKPVRYVVATHWHDDHVLGAQVYIHAFPGAEFISHSVTRDSITHEVIPSLKRLVTDEYPKTLEELKQRFASGKRRDGTPMNAEDSVNLRRSIATYTYFIAESRDVTPVAPTLTVDRQLTLHRGDRVIDIRFLGRGNTGGDLVVHLPRERVIITGDLVVAPTPYAYGSYLSDWRKTLQSLRALGADAQIVIPGHGRLQHDWSYVDLLDELLGSVLSQTQDAVGRGLDLDSTRKAINVDAIRARFTGDDARKLRGFNINFLEPAVERAYLEAKGKIPSP